MKIITLDQNSYHNTYIPVKETPCIVLAGRFHVERIMHAEYLEVYGLDGFKSKHTSNGRFWLNGPQAGIVVIVSKDAKNMVNSNIIIGWLPAPNTFDLWLRVYD